MINWNERPVEIANLLNPAFCGEVLRRCIKSYIKTTSNPFSYPLVFLILPIVLHKRTRDRLPTKRSRKKLHVWMQENQDIRIGFAQRAKSLTPVTTESITFLLQLGALKTDTEGNLTIGDHNPVNNIERSMDEIHRCYEKAELIGRLFAKAGKPSTIYLMWGITP